MKFFLEKAIFINRAPFDRMELNFQENEIAVISAVNGKGKTTILSHITDALYEMVRPHFQNEFEGKENKLYRVSSPVFNLNRSEPSFVYLRFRINDEIVDYVDIRNKCSEDQYNSIGIDDKKISYAQISDNLSEQGYSKSFSENLDAKKIREIVADNVLTSFPAYRYEMPGYLNDPYKIQLNFRKDPDFAGFLKNPIEVATGLSELANWIMDVVLDVRGYGNENSIPFNNLGRVLSETLISKNPGPLGFGIGERNLGGTRIQILNSQTKVQLYPTIFNLSSGEAALLCIFGEILRQSDNNRKNSPLEMVSGIVLIDEVEKHLHIKLQKEVLPRLFELFPNIQFITTSHSPFLGMGLSNTPSGRAKIIDIDNGGVPRDPTNNDLYTEVYEMMINENSRFKELYENLKDQVSKEDSKPLIITEGKTDVIHLKKAQEKLGIQGDFEYFETPDEGFGESKLKDLLQKFSQIKHTRKIIGIFDRDKKDILDDIEKDGAVYKDYGNNVFGFCIPVPPNREGYTNISIEFYYPDENLKKESDGKRLFFDNELNFNQDNVPISIIENPIDNNGKKILDKKYIGQLSWVLSKSAFAKLVESEESFIADFDFSKFRAIFERLNQIIEIQPITNNSTESA